MNITNKILHPFSVVILSLICLGGTSTLALADCIQKRTTPQASDNISKQNNIKTTPGDVSAGEQIYQKEAKPLACVQCHGSSGKGDGKMAKGMMPKPRDFSCLEMMKNIPDGQLFWIIQNGSKGTGMMAYPTLKDDQIWQVISYIRTFSK